ncbi:MAG: tRNA pseudouridine(38-40) synthase TruA [Pseudomonadales bacterium]|jgi:tRNA pseudouridine38-40 synthase|nr:tRNA pseudouridine(38-40) synthase TruA [Pseudomonadales bacterium]
MSGTTQSRRVALGIEYHGGAYAGWQAQRSPGVPTVQEALEAALSRVADHPVATVCAGRTDAGVHASAQVVHFDTRAARPMRAWVMGVNSLLPADVAVQWAREVGPDFHARFSARYRRYRYLVLTRAQRSALAAGSACLERRPVDAPRMHEAAQCLLGERDFSAFRGAGCQSRTPMRRLERVAVSRAGDLLTIEVEANAFLLHMVRNIAGSLLAVGTGERSAQWLAEVMASRDRTLAAATAPARGLYLVDVGYDACWGLPGQPVGPWFAC